MDFPPNILRRLFFSRPLKLSSSGGFWLSGENKTKTGMLMRPPSLPRALFFLLCYTPGIFKKAPVWWKLLAALWMYTESTRLLPGLPNIPKCQCSHSHSSQLSFCHLLSPSRESHVCPPRYKQKDRWRGCFCTCLHSGGNSITCTLLWDWNWRLASYCLYQAALMCSQKGRCVCARVLALFTHVCRYLFDVCPALPGWKVNSLISPWTQLALWLAERRPGCAVFWRKEDLWNWGGSGGKRSEAE